VTFSTTQASSNEASVAKSSDDSKPSVIPGIQNLGNTCYLSASLQTLFGIPHFLRDLYNVYNVASSNKEMPLTEALLEVATAIGVIPEADMPKIDAANAKSKLLTSKAANPSALKKQMDVLTDKFVGYEQRDAHEFLSDLVDFLHDELVSTKGVAEEDGYASNKENDRKMSPAKGQTSGDRKDAADQPEKHASELMQVPPTDDYFHLKVRVCLECDACQYSR
jgi:ubiquitin C-terminal hydrolase